MSTVDDRDLERYLRRDDALSRAYAELKSERPSPALDQAVLARARDALRSSAPMRPTRARHWTAITALAATVLLSFGLVMRLALEPESQLPATSPATDAVSTLPEASSPASDEDASAAADSKLTVPLGGTRRDAISAPSSIEEQRPRIEAEIRATAEQAPAVPEPVPPPVVPDVVYAPAPAAAAAPDARQDSAPASRPLRQDRTGDSASGERDLARTRKSEAPTEALEGTHAYVNAAEVSSPAKEDFTRTPETWLAEIARLRVAGETEAADRELERLRKAYPEYLEKLKLHDDPGAAPR